jgi:kinesin family protein 2/24
MESSTSTVTTFTYVRLNEIYEKTVKPLIDFAFLGGKVSCFAYGQTGSGKTYTMIGDYNDGKQVNGLYVLASQDIFNKLSQPKFNQMRVFASFYEIYCGKLYDLLNKRAKLEVREDARQNVYLCLRQGQHHQPQRVRSCHC